MGPPHHSTPAKGRYLAIPSSSPKPPSLASNRSNEADDELTSTEPSPSMGPSTDYRLPPVPPRYPGEDTRSTSYKEIAGFYAYGWAAEVFVVCGIGSFIPITLEQLARERGVLQSDGKTPCANNGSFANYTSKATVSKWSNDLTTTEVDPSQCIVYIGGVEINTASFAMYTFSISVLIQALLIISMSGAADHGRFRKTFLLYFGFIGAIATIMFLPVVPKVFLIGALLAMIANTCFGASFVLLNSFLPLLVRNHPSVQFERRLVDDDVSILEDETTEHEEEQGDEYIIRGEPNDTTALLRRTQSDTSSRQSKSSSPELRLSTQISSYGIAIGYLAAIIVQMIAVIIVKFTDTSSGGATWPLRLVLAFVGVWWFIFTIPAAMWLRPRPGPPLILDEHSSKSRTCFAYFSYSWRSLGRTIKKARKLKDVLLFLAAWFMISDGIATVSGTAVLFAKTTLKMKTPELAFINVVATITGVIGAFSWSRLSGLMGLRPSQTVLGCILLFEIIPLYGLLGYIPAIKKLGYLGLQQSWEMYPLGAVYGFVLGGLSSYCRSLFGELIPPGYEAAFYALYAITDKGSSIFGPAIVGAITNATGEIRPAFWFLAVLIGIPFPIMYMVDVHRGRRDAAALAAELAEGSVVKDIDSNGPGFARGAAQVEANEVEHEQD